MSYSFSVYTEEIEVLGSYVDCLRPHTQAGAACRWDLSFTNTPNSYMMLSLGRMCDPVCP